MSNYKNINDDYRETPLSKEDKEMIRQYSNYKNGNRCEPDNNSFFEERSNPLSSKGN